MSSFFRYRLDWYKLKTREFVYRYKMALMIMTLFLPGVAIGNNLFLLLKFLTQPFVMVVTADSSILQRLLSLLVLLIIFLVWARAQRTAIRGGEFARYLRSLPVKQKHWRKSDFVIMLVSNHLLWVIIVASYFYLPTGSITEITSNTLLIFMLIGSQYFVIFAHKRNTFGMKKTGQILKKSSIYGTNGNLYLQMMFQSDFSSTAFKFLFLSLLITGFRWVAPFFAKQNDNDLLPYLLIMEFLLTYFLSGFFVTFKEQRQAFGHYLKSLPINAFFWLKKDVFVVLMISVPFHLILYSLLHDFISLSSVSYLFLYHVLLIFLSYPLRIKLQQQTFFSFMTLLVITIITIYNVS